MEKADAANIASLKVAHVLMKHKRPFDEGPVVKEASLAAGESLFSNMKNKNEILELIRDMPLSRPRVTRKVELMSANIRDQIFEDMEKCTNFSLQFDESTDIVDSAQVLVYV